MLAGGVPDGADTVEVVTASGTALGRHSSTLAQPVVITSGSLNVRGIIWVEALSASTPSKPDPAGFERL
jgi:hypothetical protein